MKKHILPRVAAVLTAAILAAGLFSGCGTAASAQETAPAADTEVSSAAPNTEASAEAEESGLDEVTILYTNDVHTYIDNHEEDDDGNRTAELLSYSNIAAMKEDLQAAGENVLLVDAGDFTQGTAYGSFDEGKSIIGIMNAAGYDIATPGNHEWDYGQDRFFEMMDELAFPAVSCNFYSTADDTPVLPAYEILQAGDITVAFIGITTPETYTVEPKAFFQDENGNEIYNIYGVEDAQELYDSVQAAIDEIGDRADYVIALAHLGVEDCGKGWTSYDMIENTEGLDAVIDAHSHTVMEEEIVTDKGGNDVVLTQTGCYFGAIGVMHLRGDAISTELVTEYDGKDETVQALEDTLIAAVDEQLGEQIAVTDDDLYVMDPEDPDTRIIRNRETNLGDLIADGVYWYFNEVQELDCDVAIVNGGGVRVNVESGAVTYMTCKSVEPFGNVDCLIRVTGSDLREMLEYSAQLVGETGDNGAAAEFGGFLHVAGMRFTIDSSIPSTVQTDTDGSWTGAPTGEYKVSDIQIYNRETGEYEDLDPDASYTVAGIDYILRNGGNGYNMFTDSELILDYVETDYLIAADYFMAFEQGDDGYAHICTANSPLASYTGYLLDYENPYGAGRITVK